MILYNRTAGSVLISAFITLSVFCSVLYVSCKKVAPKKDACTNVVCENNGVCNEGKCSCPDGYDGDYCETIWNEKFGGTWLVTDSCGTQRDTFTVEIKQSATKASFITMNNFWVHNAIDILAFKNDVLSFSFKDSQNVYPGFYDNYWLTKGNGTMDEAAQNIYGKFTISYPPQGEHVFSYHMVKQ